MGILKLNYPAIYIYFLTAMNKAEALEEYSAHCKSLEDSDPSSYFRYVHGYLVPHLQQLEATGKLRLGKSTLHASPLISGSTKIREGMYSYTGQVDRYGDACGVGIAKNPNS